MNKLNIVLIEDNVGHARLIEKNLQRGLTARPLEIHQIHDGAKALQLILQSALGITLLKEWVVFIVDINLPGADGFQIIEELKTNPRTRHVPLIVLTSTDDDNEVRRCYELGCNAYIIKSVNYEIFCQSIQKLGTLLEIMGIPVEE